jgi:hypothetical protein
VKVIQLSRGQWLFLAIAVVVVLPMVALLAQPTEVDVWLVKTFELASLQKSLGFQTGFISPPGSSGLVGPVFAITAVTPAGAFWRAGIRPGDIPTGYKHGFESGFLFDLSLGKRKGVVDLRVVPMASAFKGDWTSHDVTVRFP